MLPGQKSPVAMLLEAALVILLLTDFIDYYTQKRPPVNTQQPNVPQVPSRGYTLYTFRPINAVIL